MGIIASITPGFKQRKSLPPTLEEITDLVQTHIEFYKDSPIILYNWNLKF